MLRVLLFSLGLSFLLGSSDAAAEDVDPIKVKLDRAKLLHDGQIDALRAGLLKSLDEKEDAARKSGNKKLVDQIKAEREAFESRGELPKIVPTTNYLRDGKQARANLESAYAAAVKDYIKAKMDDEAAATEKDLAAFKDSTGASGVSLSALLTPDSVWTGVRRVATAKGKLAEGPLELKLSIRDGKVFKGQIVIDKNRVYEIDGVVEGDKIAFATEKKEKFKNSFEGRLRGRTLDLIFAGTGIGGEPIKGSATLTPAKGK